MCQIDHNSLVIWTSSSNAQRSAFSLDDIQHQKGREPYSSSKYASDLLSLALNRHYNNRVSSQFPIENSLLHDMFYTVIIYDYHNCDLVMMICSQGLYSSVICPGLVMTNLTYGILPSFFWTLIMPIMWLVGPQFTYFLYINTIIGKSHKFNIMS